MGNWDRESRNFSTGLKFHFFVFYALTPLMWQAQEAHHDIRTYISKAISPAVAEQTRIIYGGSVNAKNAPESGKIIDWLLLDPSSSRAHSHSCPT
jgi:Triosephosphate isomerase